MERGWGEEGGLIFEIALILSLENAVKLCLLASIGQTGNHGGSEPNSCLYVHVVSTTETVSLSNSSLNTAVNMTSYSVDGRRLLRMYLFLLPSKSTWRSETRTNTKSPLTSRKILSFQQSVILKKTLGLVPQLRSDLTSAAQGQQVCDGHFKKRQMILHDRSFLF